VPTVCPTAPTYQRRQPEHTVLYRTVEAHLPTFAQTGGGAERAGLPLTLGCTPKLDQTEAPVVEALGKILDVCKRHKVIAGLHNASSGYALKMVSQAWQFMTLASDSRFLAARASEEVTNVKQTVASGKLPPY